MNTFTIIVIFVVLGSSLIRIWLAKRQIKHVTAFREHTPEAFQSSISDANHQKAADYTVAKVKFGLIELFYGTALFFLWTLGGGLSLLDESVKAFGLGQLSTGVVFLLVLFLIFTLLDLPFQIVQTFKLEGRFGFNRTTPRLFAVDLVKQFLLGLLIGAPLLYLVLWLIGEDILIPNGSLLAIDIDEPAQGAGTLLWQESRDGCEIKRATSFVDQF